MYNKTKIAQIHIIGKLENDILQENDAKQKLRDYLRDGYNIINSIFDEFDNCVYITIKKGRFEK